MTRSLARLIRHASRPATLALCTVASAPLAAGLPSPWACRYDADQLANASAIVRAASALGLDEHAAALGVTAALGESSLRDVGYGDGAINPDGTLSDSVGLFQQQHWWGTVAQRMDPARAAKAFFSRLEGVSGWEEMPPTVAIHTVQGNADPSYYAPYWDQGDALARALEGGPALGETSASSTDTVGVSNSPLHFPDVAGEVMRSVEAGLEAFAGR